MNQRGLKEALENGKFESLELLALGNFPGVKFYRLGDLLLLLPEGACPSNGFNQHYAKRTTGNQIIDFFWLMIL